MKRFLPLLALACALILSVSCTKQDSSATTGYAKVLKSAGRTDCEWVQLWEGGPKFAMFNVGSTITKYGDLVNKTDKNPDSVPGYCTENVGGLYPWHHPNMNARDEKWKLHFDYKPTGDVATTLWGKKWKEPTVYDIVRLLEDIDTHIIGLVYIVCDGVNTQYSPGCTLAGLRISGPVGTRFEKNRIFIPFAGDYDCEVEKIKHIGEDFYFWCSDSTVDDWSIYDFGYSVRAVLAE